MSDNFKAAKNIPSEDYFIDRNGQIVKIDAMPEAQVRDLLGMAMTLILGQESYIRYLEESFLSEILKGHGASISEQEQILKQMKTAGKSYSTQDQYYKSTKTSVAGKPLNSTPETPTPKTTEADIDKMFSDAGVDVFDPKNLH